MFAGMGLIAAAAEGKHPDTKFLPLAPAEAIRTIEASTVARVRREIADRKTPWTHEELMSLVFVK